MPQMWERIGADPFDYAFCIRPDLLPPEELEKIKSRARRSFGYTWDGLGRFEGTLQRRQFFDKLYVFDPADANPTGGIHLLGNFYFDCYPDSLPKLDLPEADAYFIGTFDRRWTVVKKICEELLAIGLKPDVQQFVRNPRTLPPLPSYVKVFSEHKPYPQALAEALRCRILLDIHHADVHDGLSLRVFEAIGHGRKLITTNPLVLSQDFYRTANIYCFGHDARSLEEFVAEPLEALPDDMRSRYGFSAWIRRALDLQIG